MTIVSDFVMSDRGERSRSRSRHRRHHSDREARHSKKHRSHHGKDERDDDPQRRRRHRESSSSKKHHHSSRKRDKGSHERDKKRSKHRDRGKREEKEARESSSTSSSEVDSEVDNPSADAPCVKFGAPPLTEEDYFARNQEFRVWLKLEKCVDSTVQCLDSSPHASGAVLVRSIVPNHNTCYVKQ